MRMAIIIDAAVTNGSASSEPGEGIPEDCREFSFVSRYRRRSRVTRVNFFSSARARAKKKSTQLYGGYGLISVAITSRVSLYYTMAVTSAHTVINYDGSRNHYRGVSCNSGVLSVYIRL